MVMGNFGVKRGGQRALPASAVSQVPSAQNNRYATVAHCRVARSRSLRDTALIHLSTCNFSVQCQYSEFDRSYSSDNLLNIPISNILYIFILSTYIFIECN